MNSKKLPTFAGSPVDERERTHNDVDLTCFQCSEREICSYVDDWYNIDGDCLAMK